MDTTERIEQSYTVDEIAELLGCSYHYVYRHIRSGSIKSYRIAGRYRVMRADLNRFLNTLKVA